MSKLVVELTEASFETAIQAEKPILIDFWAEWCGPCKMMAPILDEVAEKRSDRVSFGKVNVDSNPGIAQKLGIRGIPALLLFKNGQVIATQVGVVSAEALTAFLDQHTA